MGYMEWLQVVRGPCGCLPKPGLLVSFSLCLPIGTPRSAQPTSSAVALSISGGSRQAAVSTEYRCVASHGVVEGPSQLDSIILVDIQAKYLKLGGCAVKDHGSWTF